ncbi:MAG: hypothetical protein OHK0047_26340 [Leptolyngbyaceae cyanobacterium]
MRSQYLECDAKWLIIRVHGQRANHKQTGWLVQLLKNLCQSQMLAALELQKPVLNPSGWEGSLTLKLGEDAYKQIPQTES